MLFFDEHYSVLSVDSIMCALSFFFVQAEDGIPAFHVTGVQTCARPISVAATFTMPSTMLPSTGSSRETAGDACCTYADSLVVPGAGADCQVSGRAVSAGCSACRLVPLPASPRTASVPAGVSTATSLTKGATYWVAVLTPAGTLAVRGDAGSGTSRQALQPALTALPLTWQSAPAPGTTRLSAYVQQASPAVSLLEPVDGSIVDGMVNVAATVDDDVPILSTQFLLDGRPIGTSDSVPPFGMVWDTRQATTHEFHTLTARETRVLLPMAPA